MQGGRMAQVGTPAEVYERPVSRFVAEFLGAANILPAIVRADGVTLDLPGPRATVRAGGATAPGPALLALRPERLSLEEPAAPNRLAGVLADQAYGGETLTQTVRLDDGSLVRVTRSLRDGLGAARLAAGTKITLSWRPDACIVLPPA
jgi:ABC-type Fe3+/spermidine/putrescine transport system ATPase subunit